MKKSHWMAGNKETAVMQNGLGIKIDPQLFERKSMLADCAYQGSVPKSWVKKMAPWYAGYNAMADEAKKRIRGQAPGATEAPTLAVEDVPAAPVAYNEQQVQMYVRGAEDFLARLAPA